MTRVHVLSPGFAFPNSRGLIYPLVVHRRALADKDIEIGLFNAATPVALDCDVLIVDSKFHRDMWIARQDEIFADFERFNRAAGRVVYFDTTDSTGWIQTELLDRVHVYAKSQLLADRTGYLRSLYGHRPHTDFYNRTAGVIDDPPEWSNAVPDAASLAKIVVGWNSALADWTYSGKARMAAYQRLGLGWLLRRNFRAVAPRRTRAIPVSCRISAGYARASVAYQRREVARRLQRYAPVGRVGRAAYFRELAEARIVVSPFGYGEINYRDFEAMLCGAALLKPSMVHLETWPALWQDNVTFLAHGWDLADLESVLEAALADPERTIGVAQAAQDRYLRHLDPAEGGTLFAARVRDLVDGAMR
jgi:hypothetical protein